MSKFKYVASPLKMGWEDSADWGHGHIHFADKSMERRSVSIPQPPQSLHQSGAKQLHTAPERWNHIYSAVCTVAVGIGGFSAFFF